MEQKLYGQAEYYYAVSCTIIRKLAEKGIITEDQSSRIDDLNRKKIFEEFPSIEEKELYSLNEEEQTNGYYSDPCDI